MSPIHSVLVLGGGSAGFLAALSLKSHLPRLAVTVLRSPDIGIIGVGESTIPYVPEHLHAFLGLPIGEFFREVQPSWKVGIRFLWGPRRFFNFPFTTQVTRNVPGLSRPIGYFVDDQFEVNNISSGMMTADRVFQRDADGGPLVNRHTAYHLENERLVAYLERTALARGIEIVEDRMVDATRSRDANGDRIETLRLASGRLIDADLFIDCTGFRSELIGKALGEKTISFASSLFNDRAVVGGWPRDGEPILPYTTAETMDAGWCWRIDHPDCVNRGYVYSSSFSTDEGAEAEFRRKNPRITQTRLIHFASGRRERAWVGNVVAVGNAGGFVEPLESTALYVICLAAHVLTETLRQSGGEPGPASIRNFNQLISTTWDTIRRFLSIHFRFNTRLDTPYWRECRANADLAGGEEIVEYYQENGPDSLYRVTLMNEFDPFKLEGYYTLLLGQGVPHRRPYTPNLQEQLVWNNLVNECRAAAHVAVTVEEALAAVHSSAWRWNRDFYLQSGAKARAR